NIGIFRESSFMCEYCENGKELLVYRKNDNGLLINHTNNKLVLSCYIKKSLLYFKVNFSGQRMPQNFLEKIFGTNDFLDRSYEFYIDLSYCPICGKQLGKYINNEEDSCDFCSNSTGENLISQDDYIF